MIAAALVALALAVDETTSDDVSVAPPPSYWHDVRPLLVRHCVGCHQPAKAKGKLVLTDVPAILRGVRSRGGDEPVVVPGDPDESMLIDSLLPFDDEPPSMPKDAPPLADADVDLLRRWIEAGARDDSPPDAGATVSPDAPPVYTAPPVVTSVTVSPDGALLAVAGYHEVLLYDPVSLALKERLIGMSERIESIAFSPDGKQLAAVGGSPGRLGEVQIWSVRSGRLRISVPVGHDTLYGASWSNDGTRVAFGCPDTAVRVVDAKTGEIVLFQGAHEDWVLDTTFTADDSHLVTVSRDRSMKLIKVETQQFIDNITSITPGVLKGGLMAVDRHPERDELLIGGADGVAKIFRTYREKKRVIGDDYNRLKTFPAVPGRAFDVAYGPAGASVAVASSTGDAGAVHLFDAALDVETAASSRWSWDAPSGVYSVAFAPAGDWLAAGRADGTVTLLNAADGAPLRELVVLPAAPDPSSPEEGNR